MQLWEYGQLTLYAKGRLFFLGTKTEILWNGQECTGELVEIMNQLGQQGWELVSSLATIGAGAPELLVSYVFKRPAEPIEPLESREPSKPLEPPEPMSDEEKARLHEKLERAQEQREVERLQRQERLERLREKHREQGGSL